MGLGLKAKLLLIIAVLVFVTVSVLQVMSIRLSSTALEQQKEAELQELVSKTTETVSTSLDGARRALDVLSASPEVRNALLQNEGDGITERQTILDFFAQAEQSQSDVETIILIDNSGIVLADNSNGSLIGLDLHDRDYFQALASGRADSYLGDVITSRATGNQVIVYAQKLSTERNPFAGVVSVVLNFDKFISQNIASLHTGETGRTVLIDKAGNFVYHPDPSLLGENLLESAPAKQRDALKEMMQSATNALGHYRENGKDRVFFAQPLANWFIVVSLDEAEYLAATASIRNSGLAFGVIFILLGALASFAIANGIANPIIRVSEVLSLAGGGDLTQSVSVTSRDEVGRLAESVNSMIAGQRTILQQALSAADNVAAHSQELSASVEESNASMQQVASSVELEVAHKAQEIVTASIDALDSGQLMRRKATDGEEAVRDAVHSMEEISSATKAVHAVISQLNNASGQIGSIVVTITDIAEQTNLLALNAAIEAARAGEQGRGFAVVAEEVRKLAEQSSRAAGEIGELIINIQSQTGNAVSKIGSAAAIVESGTDRASRAMERLSEIRSASEKVKELIQDIVTQAEAQSASAQEIAASTEEQTAVLEEISATSNQLAGMAEELNALVTRFKL